MNSIDRRLDVIILGASGFTGRYVVRNLVSINEESEYSDLTWGIAGRSKEKLDCLLLELKNQGVKDIPVFECDITNETILKHVCSRAKVIVNATGPFSTLGETVVSTCIQMKTYYVDISAELHHMITIYRNYHKAAQDSNVLIITACGYGSLPGTMGFVHLEKHFDGNLQSIECYTERLNVIYIYAIYRRKIECYIEIEMPNSFRSLVCGGDNCLVHYGTWDSLVHELENFPDFFRLQEETFPESIYDPEREELQKGFFHRQRGKTWFPYPGPDSRIIDWTQRYLHEKKFQKPVNFKMYTTMPLLIHILFIIPIMYCYYWLSTFKWFRKLLRRNPRFFTAGFMSHEGPSEETMNDTKYSYILTGKGWETHQNIKTVTLKVSGINPYEATARALIFAAVTVLKDYSLMPKGGVLTTGAAFYNTQLIDRLNSHGLHFEFI